LALEFDQALVGLSGKSFPGPFYHLSVVQEIHIETLIKVGIQGVLEF
jgi:hypothetical protein